MVRVHIDPFYDGSEFYLLTDGGQASVALARAMNVLSIVFEIVVTVLISDLISGLFHWLEDAYGRKEWPVTGWLITEPNILHHHDPRYFTRHSWFHSSWLLLCIGLLILLVAWLCGVLTWHVWLFLALGANANQIHKWAHRSPLRTELSFRFFSAFDYFRAHVIMRTITPIPKTVITVCSRIS